MRDQTGFERQQSGGGRRDQDLMTESLVLAVYRVHPFPCFYMGLLILRSVWGSFLFADTSSTAPTCTHA